MLTAFLLSTIAFLSAAFYMLAVTHYETRYNIERLHELLDAKDDFDPFTVEDDNYPDLPWAEGDLSLTQVPKPLKD